MIWECKTFSELSTNELFEILKLRQQVFIVEQNCIYHDIDDTDKESLHLLAWTHSDSRASQLSAYLRIIPNNTDHKEAVIGRVIVAESVRGIGLGKTLINNAITTIKNKFPEQAIKISAQYHLEKFYSSFGFNTVSEPYDEDGIPHIRMIKSM